MSDAIQDKSEFVEKDNFEELNKILLAYPDLQTTLLNGLSHVIEITNRNGGLLIVQGPEDASPLLCVMKNSPPDWEAQLSIQNSMLRTLSRSWIQPGGLVITEHPYSPVVIFPMTTSLGQQGLLLLSGIESPEDEKLFLVKAAESFGHSIYLGRNGSILFEISKLLDSLGMIISGFNPKHTLDEAQMLLVSALRESFSCEAGSITIVDRKNPDMIIKKSLTKGKDWIYQVSVRPNEGLLGECLQTGKSVISNNPQNDERYKETIDSTPGFKACSILFVPLSNEGEVLGAIGFQNKKSGNFTPYEQQLVNTIAKVIVNSFISLQTIQEARVQSAHLEASRWELVRSRNTLRSLFDNLPDSLYIIDRLYRLTAINVVRANRVKADPPMLVGKLCYETLFNRSEPCKSCLVAETFYKKKVTYRVDRQWLDGTDPLEWEISTYPIVGEKDEAVQSILVEKDVTEKRRLEGFLAQSEKMAAVGELAAGIAHEINNPLTVILANAQILSRQIPDEQADWKEQLDLISRAGTRALHSVKNLLNFARKERFEFVPTDVNETIEQSLEMVRHELLSRSVELSFEPGENLPLIMASPNHLQGVWLNLIMNGLDAIGDSTEDGIIRIITFQQGNDVRVSIVDNGHGISPENIKRIFEPFYTTKGLHRGTGLGLSVCHRIIKQHGGLILVDSEIGRGSSFTVVLPTY